MTRRIQVVVALGPIAALIVACGGTESGETGGEIGTAALALGEDGGAASCADGVQNGTETDVDCGGGVCAPCALGRDCGVGADCSSGVCVDGYCAEGGAIEWCNGWDDDGDGLVDEDADGVGQICGQSDVGACRFGAYVCEGWLRCDGAVYPTSEVLGDGIDNDCDGLTDEVPKADLVVYPPYAYSPLLVGIPSSVAFQAENGGPDPADGLRAVFDVDGDVSDLSGRLSAFFYNIPCDPPIVLGPGRQRIVCEPNFSMPAHFRGMGSLHFIPRGEGQVTVSGTLTSLTEDPVPGDNTASGTFEVTRPRQADIAVTLPDAPDPVTFKKKLTYTMNVRNLGPDPASNVEGWLDLPWNAPIVTLTSTAGSCSAWYGPYVYCSFGELASGASAFVSAVVQPQEGGTVTASAAARNSVWPYFAEFDPDPANDYASATTTVRGPNPPTSVSHWQGKYDTWDWRWVDCLQDYVILQGQVHSSSQSVQNSARGTYRYHWHNNYVNVQAVSLYGGETYRANGTSRGSEVWGGPLTSYSHSDQFTLIGPGGRTLVGHSTYLVKFDATTWEPRVELSDYRFDCK